MRKPNTNRDGQNFDLATRRRVWVKGTVATGHDPNFVRQDVCGSLIDWAEYGNQSSSRGWHIDHKKPVAKGGGDEIENLQPLQWRNNLVKGDDYPKWSCAA